MATALTISDDLSATFAGAAAFTGAATFNGGISGGDNNITNVGDISLDSISSDGSLVTVNAPCEIANGSSAGATALVLDNDDVDEIALSIEAANTTANVIDVSATALTTGKVLHVDVGNAATTNQSTTVAHFDIDKTGIAASGQAVGIIGIDLDLNDAATNVGSAALVGLDLDIAFADAGGTTVGTGLDVSVSGGDTNYAAIFRAGQVGIGATGPQALLEVEASSTFGNTCLLVDNNDTDQIALHVDAANIDQHAVVIDADALTTKSALYIEDDSSSTSTRNTVDIVQNNVAATAATALKIQSDSNGGVAALHIDRNAAGTVAADAVTGILIDLDQTGEITSATGVVVGVDTNLETNVAGDGTLNAFGHRIVMTGDTDGTHSHTGLSINLGQADTNTHIELLSSADTGDKCTIAVAAAGATTVTTVDDDGHGADLTFTVDGDTHLQAEGTTVARCVGTRDTSTTQISNGFTYLRPTLKVTADTELFAGDSGAVIIFDDAAATITLPDSGTAANVGCFFTFIVGYESGAASAGTKKVVCADTTNELIQGQVKTFDVDTSNAVAFFPSARSSNFSAFTFNGGTTGTPGSRITILATASDEWTIIESEVFCTGSPATPLSTS